MNPFFCSRSSLPEVFCKKGVLRNFTKFTAKQCARFSFLRKWKKKRPWHRCFPVNFVKFLRTPFCKEHLWWLLLFFRKMIFWFDEFCLDLRKRSEIRFQYESLQIRLTNMEFLFLITPQIAEWQFETQVVSIFFFFILVSWYYIRIQVLFLTTDL